MILPVWAESDEHNITTYPRMLLVVGSAERLHIDDGTVTTTALCGVGCSGIVEYISEPRPVCRRCRVEAAKMERGE